MVVIIIEAITVCFFILRRIEAVAIIIVEAIRGYVLFEAYLWYVP